LIRGSFGCSFEGSGSRQAVGGGVDGTNLPANPHCKRPLLPVSPLDYGHLAIGPRAGTVEDLVRVPVVAIGVGVGVWVVGEVVVRVGVRHFWDLRGTDRGGEVLM
jgi:hypothetical protein